MPHKKEGKPSKPPTGSRPGPDRLAHLMDKAGIPLDADQVKALWTFHTFLRERNRELNMTRIHNFENMVLKHYVDSIIVTRLVDLPSPLLDIGSGPGFPGIPIGIARPDLRIILAEGRRNRAGFLEEAVRHLGLDGVEVYGHKVGPGFPERVGGVITRALEDIPETLDRVFPFLDRGGLVVFMKGPDCDGEIEKAKESARQAFRLVRDTAYTLPGSRHKRRLVVFERTGAAIAHPAFAGPVKEIASPSNARFRMLRSLLTGKGIRKEGQTLLSGVRFLDEIVKTSPRLCRGWITPQDKRKAPPPPAGLPEGTTWYRLDNALFRELDVSGTKAPLLLADLPPMQAWNDSEWPAGCTLFVPFQDPENAGAVLRTAAAFGAARAILLSEAAHPFLPKSQRAAGSALFRIPLFSGPSINDLDVKGAPLLTLSQEGRKISSCDWPEMFGLLPGLEGPGLPERFKKENALRIPMEPGAESLNAAAAVAVALYEWRHGS